MIDKEEARARLIAMAENTPKGVQRDALVMGATSLAEDIAIQWLEEHDKQIRADVIEEVKETINNNGAFLMNPQITEYDKGSNDAFEIVLDILKQLKEQK